MSFFGIDFGTTNTAVTEYLPASGSVTIVHHGDNESPIPSLVAIHPDGDMKFGREVKISRSQLVRDGYHVFSSFKTILGTDTAYTVGSKEYTATDVTALFLRYLRDKIHHDAPKGQPVDLTSAAFAIPVDFKPEQRRALREAARRAGIKVVSFVSEPTAAFISCKEQLKGCSNVVVVDWGGGTLDVSVVSETKDSYSELAVGGIRLGGNDIDQLIARHMHTRIMQSEAVPCTFEELDPKAKDTLIERSEAAKITLTTEDYAQMRLVHYGSKPIIRESLSFDELDKLVASSLDKVMDLLITTVAQAGLSLTQLDAVLMVGGSCEMRSVCARLDEIGEREHVLICHPDELQWVVADGAAKICCSSPSYCLQSSLGVQLSDGSIFPILNEGAKIPCKSDELCFGLVEDTKTAVFVFTDGQGTVLRRVQLPVKGFTAERLLLNASIDSDLIAHVHLTSDYLTRFEREEEFNRLRYVYQMR